MSNAEGVTWDLGGYFPSFDGPEREEFRAEVVRRLDTTLAAAGELGTLDGGNQEAWEHVVLAMEDLKARFSHMGSHLSCLSAADARNEDYAAAQGELHVLYSRFGEIQIEFLRALKETRDADFDAFLHRPELSGAAHALRRARENALRTTTPEKEVLASKLELDGLNAWGRLYNTLSGRLEFTMEWPDGRTETLPMARRRSLLEDADPRVRRAAFEGGNAAWRAMEPVTAASINHIAGSRLTMNRERGITDYLEPALFQAGIERETLDAMYEAIDSRLPLLRRFARVKARLLGREGIAWHEIGCALPAEKAGPVSWEEATDMVETSFRGAYPDLADFFRRCLDMRWIEAEPRAGKRPGAFCSSSHWSRESRVYMTFGGTLGDVRTLAHEAGHAWHSQVMRDIRSLARSYPMTLAESASTFAERILSDGLRDSGDDARRREVAGLELSEVLAYLLDITARFRFERSFHDERLNGEVKASRLCELMAAAQRDVLGDALAPAGEDPLYWASKLHFHIAGTTFYNFPYTFGFLLSQGLHRLFREEGPAFLPRYEEFLRATGSDTPEAIARATVGLDLRDPAFWGGAIDGLEPILEQFPGA